MLFLGTDRVNVALVKAMNWVSFGSKQSVKAWPSARL